MFKTQRSLIAGLLSIVLLTAAIGCKSKFERLKASNDNAKKYQEAVKYYNKKDFGKALELFDDLAPKYRGRVEAEDLFYFYAFANYKLKDYTSARYHFKNFADTYPTSARAEECRYMAAYCFYLDSPNATLDQENTTKAIESLQLFINLYPKSERSVEAGKLIQTLHEKLEEKAYRNARLYYDVGDHLSAVMAFNNALRDYPDTKYAEEMEFLIIRSQYLYAKGSQEYKQEDRFGQAITYADQFSEKYPNSKYVKEAADYKKDSQQGIERAKRVIAAAETDMKLAKKIANKDTTEKVKQSITDKQDQKSPQ
jgi:outer membrane protein assembly factor BamD